MKILSVILVLLLSGPGTLRAEASKATALPNVNTYEELITAIRRVRAESGVRVEKAVERERVREAWETGRLIDEHILHHQERAQYGEQVIVRLAGDLGTSDTELKYMLQFARAYPIRPPADELSWAHYRELLSVNDPKERDEVTRKAKEKSWTRDQVRKEVKTLKSAGVPVKDEEPTRLPAIMPGPLDTYAIIRLKDSLKIDLGFGIYRDLSTADAGHKYKEGDIVTSVKTSDGTFKLQKNESRGTSPESRLFYTYRALVTQTVDGDTFHALIDLGFGMTLAQRVRLRRIDAPEVLTAEGKEAKALLEKILARDGGKVILRSRELDQHGRPIADVWVEGKSIDQELLDQGLAVKMED